jgi:hypothetical protein
MKALISIITSLFLFCLVWGMGVVSMIYGWGVEPKSWAVIIWTGIGSLVLTMMISFVSALAQALVD